MAETTRPFPHQPTASERTSGLNKARLADLQRIAAALKVKAQGKPVDEAIDLVSEDYGVKPSTYRRRFGELARLAKWKSTRPEDWLEGKESPKAGGYRHGRQTAEKKVHRGGWAPPSDWAAFDLAREKLGLTFESFCLAAAGHVNAGGRFLTLDSQKASD